MAKQMLNRRLGLSVDSLGGVLNLVEQRARQRSAQDVSPERLIREILVSEGWLDHEVNRLFRILNKPHFRPELSKADRYSPFFRAADPREPSPKRRVFFPGGAPGTKR